MILKAKEISKYMEIHSVDKVPVEVINTELPESKELRQSARKLAKRLVITHARTGNFGGGYFDANTKKRAPGVEAVSMKYMMYNSFKKSECYLPAEWELEVLAGEVGEKILVELADHSGNLEQKFRDVYTKHIGSIQEKVSAAAKLLKEAEKLSEEHGIPFNNKESLVDGSCQGYFPHSFDSIFGELMNEDSDVVNELTGVYQYDGNTGWQSSAGTC